MWWGFYLFVISGVIWAAILVPCQIVQARQAKVFAETGVIPPSYWVYGRIWLWFGIAAILIPLANVYWMVIKA
ncbi:Predicted integral membrane protein [Shimia gijangensis]|uniref:Predicted integral membrane protein n=1 Tax=Shimia gijangensis TaxID=1470563 RepID=A0A1M6RYV1_9RHOB|nr:Predicted integral membrane protein [Shimia gijangensis]